MILPMMVASSQSPIRECKSTIAGRSSIQTRPIRLTTAVIAAIMFATFLLITQVVIKVATMSFILEDKLVDPFMADRNSTKVLSHRLICSGLQSKLINCQQQAKCPHGYKSLPWTDGTHRSNAGPACNRAEIWCLSSWVSCVYLIVLLILAG